MTTNISPLDAVSAPSIPGRIGFGASGLGTLTWDVPDDVAQAILDAAWAAGFRYYDTSPLYGFGLSELRLGRFLRNVPRADYILSTKVGRYFVPPKPGETPDKGGWVRPQPLVPILDYSYDGFMRSLEQSYNRLGVAAIDIVYIHDLDRRNLKSDFDRHYKAAVESGYKALDELRRAGVLKAIGVGLNESDVAANLIRNLDLDLVMLAGRYTLLEQPALEDFLPEAEKRGVGVVDVGVFNSGILVKPPEAGGNYDYGAAPEAVIQRARAIRATCEEFGVEMPAAAVQFPFGHSAVKSVVVGMSKLKAVHQNMDWFNAKIPVDLWAALKERGLLAVDAPTP
ncbi:putative oxidoreductase, aryl-alcohol dehydrogenase like protein [uncultured Pleomorphomonas sp.]|uniref:Putative oxidoreductase, aryl-alcohol dehydrogenase like protein n=1 Tax=uncultured Pleomorphomonas sp. TaxID=442121 RepID=A0A212LH42_9HYPH|nr:aldo/keto reductase [uncultured Pleomorphomonas sp.]SCM76818.1 putative oxidoreductase, aryl-alcohol dehydrogenase like protein [uncultured Pleomorphomonas sp.]